MKLQNWMRIAVFLMALPVGFAAGAQQAIPLWPNGAPGSEGKAAEESVRVTEQGDHVISSVHRAAIGARLTLQAGKMLQVSEVRSGSSYLSQNDLRLHFGLGEQNQIDKVEIRWPSGKVEALNGLAADCIYTIVEGKGKMDSTPFLPVNPAIRPRR